MIINDRYVVECVIGRGAMAVVYRVRHIQLNTLHAMKLLMMPSLAVQKRLIQEGRVQASLRHRNIVSVTDVVEVDGSPALVMEYIEGPSLDELIAKHDISFEQANLIGKGIIMGVAAAHEHGMIHRDMKPANIMLAVSNGGLVPKVADFGLAKLLEGDATGDMTATRSGIAMGTPAYMAPEQFRDAKSVDERADVFSIGAILYELSCGKRPFQGDNFLDVYQNVADGNFTPPQEVIPDLPDCMADAIVRALKVERDERIPSCAALLKAWTNGFIPSASLGGLTTPTSDSPWDANLMSMVSSLSSSENLAAQELKAIEEAMSSGSSSTNDTWSGVEGADSGNFGASFASYGSASATMALAPDGPLDHSEVPSETRPTTNNNDSSGKSSGLILFLGGIGVAGLIGIGALLASGIITLAPKIGTPPPVEDNASAADVKEAPPEPTPPQADPEPRDAEPSVNETPVTNQGAVGVQPDTPLATTPKSVRVQSKKKTPTPTKSDSTPIDKTKTPVVTDVGDEAPIQEEKTTNVVEPPPPTVPVGPPPNKARVKVKGDARRVWLANSKGNFSPGDLEPGSYKILVLFQGQDPLQVGDVTLKAGVEHVITCQKMFSKCKVR